MAKFKVEIDTDNDAFVGDPAAEISRILQTLARRVENQLLPHDYFTKPIADSNGNHVGKYTYRK